MFDDFFEAAVRREIEAVAFGVGAMMDEPRRHHRHQGQGDRRGDHDRRGERDREFMEQPSSHVAHEQQRNQHRDQGDGQRDDGEADLSRAAQRRLHRLFAAFDIAGDVLDHHNRVVDDEAGRDRERHEREIVEAESQQIHDAETADQGQRRGEAGDERRREGAQKNEDHENDENDREAKLEFHVGDGGANRRGAIVDDIEFDRGRKVRLNLRQEPLDVVRDLNHIGARLALNVQNDRRRAVAPGREKSVLGPLDDVGYVGQTHRIAVAIGDEDGLIFVGASSAGRWR